MELKELIRKYMDSYKECDTCNYMCKDIRKYLDDKFICNDCLIN